MGLARSTEGDHVAGSNEKLASYTFPAFEQMEVMRMKKGMRQRDALNVPGLRPEASHAFSSPSPLLLHLLNICLHANGKPDFKSAQTIQLFNSRAGLRC